MLPLADIQQEAIDAGTVRQPFIAVGPGWIDGLHLHRLVPIRGAGDGAVMCPEADQCCLVSEALAAKLADIQLVTLPDA
jgi:hypothetical protein